MGQSLLLARWAAWEEKFGKISRRERLMVSAAVLVGLLMIGGTMVVEPAYVKRRQATVQVAEQTESAAKLRLQLAEVQERLKLDPNAAKKTELTSLEARLKAFDETIAKNTSALVQPTGMNAMLERILSRQAGLRLLSLRNLPPVSVMNKPAAETKDKDKAAASGSAPKFDLYRHGVEITVAGNYQEIVQYLKQLESAEPKLLWGEFKLTAKEYPVSELTVVVYTLSSERTWLSI